MLDWGNRGPLCLLLHANGFCAETWAPVAEGLALDHHVVALDARGHGASARVGGEGAYRLEAFVADLAAVVARLCADRGDPRIALLAGHSWGGATALRYAIGQPPGLERLMLFDPVIVPAEWMALRPPGDMPLATKARRRRARFRSRAEAERLWSRSPFFQSFDAQVFQAYLRGGLRECPDGTVALACDPEVEAAVFNSGPTDPAPDAHLVRARTLVWRAASSPFPLEGYERTVAAIADARMEVVQAGHLIPMEQPAQAAAGMRALLQVPA